MRGGACAEGCSSRRIDIHLNHKSELSRALWGGEIIIGLVLDYTHTLCRAEAGPALQMRVAFVPPTTSPQTHTHPHRCARCDPLIWMRRGLRCDVGLVGACQATSWDRSTRVYNGGYATSAPSRRQ